MSVYEKNMETKYKAQIFSCKKKSAKWQEEKPADLLSTRYERWGSWKKYDGWPDRWVAEERAVEDQHVLHSLGKESVASGATDCIQPC